MQFLTKPKLVAATVAIFLTFICNQSFSQLPGFINRQATSVGGRAILDPNGDGYTSASTAGFGNDDVLNTELIYTGIKAYPIEPFGDLARGPNHNFSDFVPDTAGSGVYYRFSAGNNVMFRMRLGSIVPGSKGYSILMDTDGKFGASGANADPNYQAATTGTNGNPGFEIEIVLETNFRIAIYNVDGTSSPVLVKQYTNWQDMSQVSVASTNDNGDPDFLIDFYIPFSDLQAVPFNLTAASSIRMAATTVMSPQAAIGGPRSDIYGVSGNNYEDFIGAQPGCSIFTISPGCSTTRCTASPLVNSPLSVGTVNISGVWTKSTLAGAAATATVTVYKNGSPVGTVSNVSSGNTWTLNSISLINGDVITAKAQATGESMCLTSNTVTVSACNSSNVPAMPVLTCNSGSKGVGGTNLATGWTVHVDNLTRAVLDNSVTNGTGLFGAPTGSSPNITWIYSGGCSSGAPLTSGSYKIYYTDNVSGCNSEPAYFCAAGNGGSALAGSLAIPNITAPANTVFTTATKNISGTTDANAVLYLYINGIAVQNTTATAGGAFSFSGLNLLAGQQLYIVAELNTGTVSTSKCESQTIVYTVGCFTQVPLISADNNNQLTAGAPIAGTSTEIAGTTIRVYTSTNTLVATTTVQANGTWSTGNAGTTPATYNAVATTTYYANAQNGSCGVSTNSANYSAATATAVGRCGSITGPVTSGVANISGTLNGSFTTTTVNLYLDGELIGTANTTNAAWGPIAVNTLPTNTLYPNAILRIGVQESSKQEVVCPLSALAIVCTPSPVAPAYSVSSGTVNQYQTITVTINNAATGSFYALSDSATGQSYGQGKWATTNGTLILNTNVFNTAGTYKIKVNATSMSGVTLCSAVSATSTIIVNPVVLPLYLVQFTGKKETTGNLLEWITENELNLSHFEIERSTNGNNFTVIAIKNSAGAFGSRTAYSFEDITATGTSYYRLKMIDNDGKLSYSNMVVISSTANGDFTISNVAPNPFIEKISLTVTLNKAVPLQLQVIDFSGRLCSIKNIDGKKGNNFIELNNLVKIAKGMYYIRVNTANAVLQQKVLKVQ
jgi:hypothetical protein